PPRRQPESRQACGSSRPWRVGSRYRTFAVAGCYAATESVLAPAFASVTSLPTTSQPPNLAQQSWLRSDGVRRVFTALTSEGAEVRVVGGAVRNALLGLPVVEVDFAT